MTRLEQALRELGPAVAFPPEPDVATRVAATLAPRRPPWRRPLVLALAALVAALAVALAVPPARSAILELLGLRGATIERVERRPGFDLLTSRPLGVRVTLREARERADFGLLVPDGHAGVFFDGRFPGGAVTFGWAARRLWLTELRGAATPYVQKSAGPGTEIVFTPVEGAPGYWLAGERHRVVFRDARGEVLEDRAAGNVLLWERGDLLLRLEGARSRAEALRIAGTLEPAAG